ncbi:hypothetical protein JK223_02125 [Tatumella sp. JGM118]|nr:hypothetical protein [Tatumella sp. JGM118]
MLKVSQQRVDTVQSFGDGNEMLIRSLLILALLWLIMLFSGYGVLTGSHKIAFGLGLSCQYLTAKGMTVSRYLHSEGGFTGKAECPLFRKNEDAPLSGGGSLNIN